MLTFSEFLVWERTTHDTIDFKKVYADMAADTLAGLVLSQLVYWHMPSKTGESKMRVNKQGKQWVAIRRYDWWESTRLSPRQVDRIIKTLVNIGLIEKATWLFDGLRTLHVRIIEKKFMELWQHFTTNPPVNPYLEDEKADESTKLPNGDLSTPNYQTVISVLPNGDFGLTQSVTPITENTTKTTTETKKKKESAPTARVGGKPLSPFQDTSQAGLFKAIARHSFKFGEGDKIPKKMTGRIGKVTSAVREMSPAVTVAEMDRVYRYAREVKSDMAIPTGEITLVGLVQEFRQTQDYKQYISDRDMVLSNLDKVSVAPPVSVPPHAEINAVPDSSTPDDISEIMALRAAAAQKLGSKKLVARLPESKTG